MYLKKGLGLYLAHENPQMAGFWNDVWDEVRDVYDDWRHKRPPGSKPPVSGESGIPREAWYAIAAVAVIALWPKGRR